MATQSKARLRRCEERDSPNGRTPIIGIPSRSSNSTAEPTTSSIRGSTLTWTPADLAIRISSTIPAASVVVGSDDDAVQLEIADDAAQAVAIQRVESSSPSSGNVATTTARARDEASFSRIRSARRRSPMIRQRSMGVARPPTERAIMRAPAMATKLAAHSARIWSPPRFPSTATDCRMVTLST